MKCDFRNNSISVFRLIAALNVLYGHTVTHLAINQVGVIGGVLGWISSFVLSVPLFFFLTGFLVTHSLEKEQSAKYYFTNRFLRIYPELWVAVIASIISIVILYEQCKAIDLSLFAITQGSFLQFWTPQSLRGFGCGTPNGSLWTISIFVQYYLFAWIVRNFLRKSKKFSFVVMEVIFIAIGYLSMGLKAYVPELVYKLFEQTLIPYMWIFGIGMILSKYFDEIIPRISRHWYAFVVVYIGWGILSRLLIVNDINIVYPVIKTVLFVLVVISIAYRFPRLELNKDISYGIYIYHMVIVNIMIEMGYIQKSRYLILVIAFSVLIAYASSYLPGMIRRKC